MPTHRLRLRSPAWPAWPAWLRRTARFRFTAVYGGLFLLSGAVLVAITYILFQHATQYSKPRLPQVPHTPAIQALEVPTPLGKDLDLPRALAQATQDFNQLSHAQQQLSILSAPRPTDGPTPLIGQLTTVQHQLAQDQQHLTQDQHQLSQTVNQLAQAVHQVAQAGTVQAAQRTADSHQLLVNSGIALAIVAVLALLAGWLVAGRMLRPIRTITRTAQRISSTNLHQRLALVGPQDELKELGDTLDDLFGRLDAAFEAQRHFVANASHELRTPLTAERNLLQVALDDPRTSEETWRDTATELLASNDEQKGLIDALLALASSEGGLEQREHTDLAGICQAVLVRSCAGTERLRLQVETVIEAAPLDGDPRLLESLVTNLVSNAIGHNVAGGHVRISTGTTDGKAVLSVTNTGPLILPGEVDRLFQPFQRLDPRRTHHNNGHGLGLSIVRAIATTHHATINADPLADGGFSVTVTFPPPTSFAAGTRSGLPLFSLM
jgi:signal transduction histidine kinase